AVRGPRLRGGVPVQRRAPGDLREQHAAAAQAVRPRRRPAGRDDEHRRRGHPGACPAAVVLPAARRGPRAARRTAPPRAARRLRGGACAPPARHARDPVYLDDPSIHIPAPPPGLAPAAGAVVRDGRSTRRALTTASLDLASRGLIAFDATQAGLLGTSTELSI